MELHLEVFQAALFVRLSASINLRKEEKGEFSEKIQYSIMPSRHISTSTFSAIAS